MSKILVVTNHSYMLYRFRKELIQNLMEEHEVVLSMPFVGHEDDFKAMGCKCIDTEVDRRGMNPVTDLRLMGTYKEILKAERPDLVITYSIKPNVYMGLLCRMKHIPYCANVQGLGTAFQSKKLAFVVTQMYKTALKKAKTVFFENQGNADVFLDRGILKNDKITVLHGAGINMKEYDYQPYPNHSERHFLYLGRIMKEKGMDEWFYAAKRLKEEYGDRVAFDMVGFFEDEYKETVEKLQKEGVITFHGFREEPRPYYAMSDCVVLPSYHEGMSNVLLEAAAMGRPVITSDIPGCREAVEDGKNGYLCEVENAEMLYDRMKQIMECSREELSEMGKYGRAYMKEHFDKKEVVKETVKAIRG